MDNQTNRPVMQQPVTPLQAATPPAPKPSNALTIVLAVFSLILLAATALFAYQTSQLQTKLAELETQMAPSEPIIPGPNPPETPPIAPAETSLVSDLRPQLVKEFTVQVDPEKIAIIVNQLETDYAMGTFTPPAEVEGSGAVWYAVKQNGVWALVLTTQEAVACSQLKTYDFPASFSCY